MNGRHHRKQELAQKTSAHKYNEKNKGEHHVRLNTLGRVGVAESAERLFVRVLRRRDGCNHHRLRVSTKILLQKPRQHRVTVPWRVEQSTT